MSSDKKKPEQEPVDVSHEEMDELKRDMRSAQLTAWAQANQNKLIAGVVVFILLLVGISMWKENRQTQRASAATLYHQALAAPSGGDRASLLQTVMRDYDNTVYGGLSRLLLAASGDEQADAYLQEVLDRSDMDAGIKMQARLDLAQLHLNKGDKGEARKLLATRGGADYEQLRHYLMAQAADTDAERLQHLQKARDAVANDAELSKRIEQEISAAGAPMPQPGQG
ncbi:MAG: tetratricopeptide repeat protein [Mariprofundaceae bacterium]|nr:tetratricopeptide repeat protein [Mariprofundaceae bacterium]